MRVFPLKSMSSLPVYPFHSFDGEEGPYLYLTTPKPQTTWHYGAVFLPVCANTKELFLQNQALEKEFLPRGWRLLGRVSSLPLPGFPLPYDKLPIVIIGKPGFWSQEELIPDLLSQGKAMSLAQLATCPRGGGLAGMKMTDHHQAQSTLNTGGEVLVCGLTRQNPSCLEGNSGVVWMYIHQGKKYCCRHWTQFFSLSGALLSQTPSSDLTFFGLR